MSYSTFVAYFDNEVNTSLQAKPISAASSNSNADAGAWDMIYFTPIDSTTKKQNGEVSLLGECIAISDDRKRVTVRVDDSYVLPTFGDYFLFSKDNKINTAGLTGYYAEVEMKNDSTSLVELFAVSSEVVKTSK